jgi:hypothetical protein
MSILARFKVLCDGDGCLGIIGVSRSGSDAKYSEAVQAAWAYGWHGNVDGIYCPKCWERREAQRKREGKP